MCMRGAETLFFLVQLPDAKINKILFLPASDMVPESKTASTQPDALSY
ncbi:hypothetical protein BFJ70_g2039 [Fusarium oxysporum]|nr:hypothetical protein BFJ70_g2039 [Fusarium oxysporum]